MFFLDHYKEDTNDIIEIGKNRIGVIGFVDGVGDDYDEDKGNRNVKNKSKKTIWEKLNRKQNNKKDAKKMI